MQRRDRHGRRIERRAAHRIARQLRGLGALEAAEQLEGFDVEQLEHRPARERDVEVIHA